MTCRTMMVKAELQIIASGYYSIFRKFNKFIAELRERFDLVRNRFIRTRFCGGWNTSLNHR